MKPATKKLIEGRIREMLRRAQDEDERASEEEASAHGRRVHANECREVAAELQALLDAPLTATLVPAQPITPTVHYDGSPYNEIGKREVQHVDTDEPEATGIPPHVWLYRIMLTEQQAVAPLGRDETNGQYAVAIDDLTDAQRAIPHVASQLPGDVLTVAVVGNHEANEIVQRAEVR